MGPSSSFHEKLPDAVPEPERRSILLRAYAEAENKESQSKGPDRAKVHSDFRYRNDARCDPAAAVRDLSAPAQW